MKGQKKVPLTVEAVYRQGVNQKSKLKFLYGLSAREYNQRFKTQKGCCAICERHQSEFNRALGVDHNHEAGQIRGLLCTTCNAALGFFQESPAILIKAIQYLKKHNNRRKKI